MDGGMLNDTGTGMTTRRSSTSKHTEGVPSKASWISDWFSREFFEIKCKMTWRAARPPRVIRAAKSAALLVLHVLHDGGGALGELDHHARDVADDLREVACASEEEGGTGIIQSPKFENKDKTFFQTHAPGGML
jgi:hypothetical protein